MNAEAPTTVNALMNNRRMFRVHVGAVVLTAALVVPLLLGITSIPSWVSVAYCVVIATVAITFVASAVKNARDHREVNASNRIEFLVVTLALSTLQVIFILPVLICVYAPTLRL